MHIYIFYALSFVGRQKKVPKKNAFLPYVCNNLFQRAADAIVAMSSHANLIRFGILPPLTIDIFYNKNFFGDY